MHVTSSVKFAVYVVSQAKHCVQFFLGHTKNIYEILVFDHEFSARSPSPVGDFENPLGQHAVPSGQSEDRREALRASLRPSLCPSGTACCPRGFSKSPPGSGDLGENSLSKTRISYINFSL